MAERSQATTAFKEGQNTNDHKGDAPKAAVKFKMSKVRNVGQPDALTQALTAPPREFDDTKHFLKRGVESGGHHYQPDAWGKVQGKPQMKSKATSLKPHTSRPGENPLGKAMNRVGQKSGYSNFKPHGGGGGKHV